MTLWALGMLDWFSGRLRVAHEIAKEARQLAEQSQLPHGRVWVGRLKALIEADLGLVEEARASAHEGLAMAEAYGNEFFTIVSLGSLGRVDLALGNLEPAGRTLRDLPARLLAGGIYDPTVPVWADAIEALISLGELERASEYLEHFERHASRLASAWALCGAARCRGLLMATDGDLALGIASAERSLLALDGFDYPLERGRSLLVVGALYRQAQRKGAARTALGEALAIFEAIEAAPWADQARSELRRISGRRPPPSELTETELQVATLAAQGLSNRQIAATLHMAVSTVEAHLSRVYRKLGGGRAELAGRLQSLDAAKPMGPASQT